LIIQLAGQGNSACAAPAEKNPPWFRIDPGRRRQARGTASGPGVGTGCIAQPFLEHVADLPVTLPVVFVHTPDAATLQGAGVLASWFGSLADDSGVRYYTRLGDLPKGNAIVLLVGTEGLAGVAVPPQTSVSLQSNPRDPYGSCC